MVKSDSTKHKDGLSIPGYVVMESVVGAVCLLATKSDKYKKLSLGGYESLIMPSIKFRQFFLLRNKKNEPIAYINWALVSDEIEKKFLAGNFEIKPNEWKSGSKLYIINVISPFISELDALKQLNENYLKNREAKILLSGKFKGFKIAALQSILTKAENNKKSSVEKPDHTQKSHKTH